MPLLEIQDLKVEFAGVRALDGVSLSLESGGALCLVGESGSGKTVTALSIARLLPSPPARYVGGKILLAGRSVLDLAARDLRAIRGGVVSYIFQEPGASLNPLFRVGTQIKEALKLHRPETATDAEVIRLLKLVGIPAAEARVRAYPHELSGGMQQRLMIAMAIASRPKLLIADEPTTALDVTIQAQIIDLLGDLRRQLGMATLLITHNLALVGEIAEEIAVMYAGQIVERGRAEDVLSDPRHPYTRALIRSVPEIGREVDRLTAIPGNVPSPGAYPSGCRFHPRCPIATTACASIEPVLENSGENHWVRCPFQRSSPAK